MGDRFERDRAGDAGPDDLGASWVSQGAGGIGLLVLGFVVFPFWTAFAGTSLGALAVAWWLRAHRKERPWHRRRLRSRPQDPDDAARTDLEG